MYNSYQMGGGIIADFSRIPHLCFKHNIDDWTARCTWHKQLLWLCSHRLLVLCAFLITKSVWSESAAFIVAFLVAISRFDIEMTPLGRLPKRNNAYF